LSARSSHSASSAACSHCLVRARSSTRSQPCSFAAAIRIVTRMFLATGAPLNAERFVRHRAIES
jgi:hypothetical protein